MCIRDRYKVVSKCGDLRMTCVPRNSVKLLQCTWICYAQRVEVKQTGMDRYHPPPKDTRMFFQVFPVRKSGVFHNPITKTIITFSWLHFYVYFLDSWPPQIRAHFDGYHFFTICRGVYWAQEYQVLVLLWAVGQSQEKKKKTVKKSKEQKYFLWRCRVSN